MSDNNKHKAVVWIKEPLIEEKSSIQNNKIGISLDAGNNLRLEGQGVRVRENHLVELLYVHHCSALFSALSIKLSNNED